MALVAAACGGDDSSSEAAPVAATDEAPAELSLGVLVMVQAQLLDDIVAEFEATVVEGLPDTDITFEEMNANGDQSLIASMARDLAASDHDAFVVIGTPAVIALAQQVTDRPVFALAMGDPVDAEVTESLEESGTNVTGSIDYVDPALLLDEILGIHPDLAALGTPYDPSNQNLQVWVEDLRAAADEAGVSLVESAIASTGEVAQGTRSLMGRVDAILVGPDANVIAALDAVGATAVSEGVPLYVSGGDATVDGVLGSIGPDYLSLGRLAGEIAIEVLQGTDPAATAWATPGEIELSLNGQTLAALGLELPQAVLESATVIE